MSNQPPYQPGQGYPPPGQPPFGYGGQPPMGQPQAYGQGYPPAPGQPFGVPPARPGNGWGVTSFVFSLLCCTGIPSLLAILFGMMGLRSAKRNGSGRGLAITGIILGLLGVLVWGAGAIGWRSMQNSTAPNRALAEKYIAAIEQAAAAPTPADGGPVAADGFTFEKTDLDDFRTTAGGAKVSSVWTYMTFASGQQAVSQGFITYSNGERKTYQMMQARDANGQWTVDGFQVVDPGRVKPMRKFSVPATQP